MPTIDVESYTIRTSRVPNGGWYVLELTSPDQGHGIRTHVSVVFVEGQPPDLGFAYNVYQPNFDGLLVWAVVPKADFAVWYDLLRNERPIRCEISYETFATDPSQNHPTRELYWIALSTGEQETPGEGPEGVQSTMAFPQHILDILPGVAKGVHA